MVVVGRVERDEVTDKKCEGTLKTNIFICCLYMASIHKLSAIHVFYVNYDSA